MRPRVVLLVALATILVLDCTTPVRSALRPVGCKISPNGAEYKGGLAKSISGLTCQTWTAQTPQKHTYTKKEYFADKDLTLAGNFCRNPQGKEKAPWCFTTTKKRWEYCKVPDCPRPATPIGCKNTTLGETYKGGLNVTKSGYPCQHWSLQFPQKHTYNKPQYFPDKDLHTVWNFCRNPQGKNSAPWCYTTKAGKRWESCKVPDCPREAPPIGCMSTPRGAEYRGGLNKTESGLLCQAWASQSPHKHQYTKPQYFEDHDISQAGNFCRNPQGKSARPWCFTTSKTKKWEYCEVPNCLHPEETGCKNTKTGRDYKGKLSTTIEGYTCQSWASQKPHKHIYTIATEFPDNNIKLAGSHCRNPSNSKQPWCFTTRKDVRWGYCSVPNCVKAPKTAGCKKTPKGTEYTGTLNMTASGHDCLAWDKVSPTKHTFVQAAKFPEKNIKTARNYCRNPSNSEKPWCYTTVKKPRWEYCNVPNCPKKPALPPPKECLDDDRGASYRGKITTTSGGYECQKWSIHNPQKHWYTKGSYFADKDILVAENFCRNPGGASKTVWCYTNDPKKRWDYCFIPKCNETKPIPIATRCPKGWSSFGDQCYQFNKDKKAWEDAQRACQLNGAHLASLETLPEQIYLQKKVENVLKTSSYIGLNDVGDNTEKVVRFWRWQGAFPWLFHPGQPDNANGREHCGIINYSLKGKQKNWEDYDCNSKTFYICKQAADPKKKTCPGGWKLRNSYCYYFGYQKLTWIQAREVCRKARSRLINIESIEEQEYLMMSDNVKGYTWIGINDRAQVGYFKWQQDVKYWGFMKGQPNNYQSKEDCVAMAPSRGAKWYDENCEKKLAFVCERPLEDGLCSKGWETNKPKCLMFLPLKKSWNEAMKICMTKYGAYLAKIESAAENRFVQRIIKGRTWIGLNDVREEGNYVWQGYSTFYHNWRKGEPNNYRNLVESCVSMGTDGKWGDYPCKMEMPYICQMPEGTKKPKKQIQSELDVIILLDSSAASGKQVFDASKAFVLKLLRDYNIDKNGMRIVLLYYSKGDVKTYYFFGAAKQNVKRTYISVVESLNYVGDNRDVYLLVEKMYATLWDHNVMRPRFPKLVVLLGGFTPHEGFMDRIKQIIKRIIRYQVHVFWLQMGKTKNAVFWSKMLPNEYMPQIKSVTKVSSMVTYLVTEASKGGCMIGYIAHANRCYKKKPFRSSKGKEMQCPKGWYIYGDQCYLLLKEKKTWGDATGACASYNAHLPAIRNVAENRYIYELITKFFKADTWLGLHDHGDFLNKDRTRSWRWEGLSYWGFAYGQPDRKKNDQHCAYIKYNPKVQKHWHDADCTTTIASVCEKEKDATGCDKGWKPFQDSCYLFNKDRVPWKEARRECQKEKASLVTVNDAQEEQFLIGYIKTNAWIGFTEAKKVGYYRWQRGVTFWNFAPLEPNHAGGNEDCISVYGSGTFKGEWADLPCSLKLNFVCELPGALKCFGGWKPYGRYCYLFVNQKNQSLAWERAGDFCSKYGATLARILDKGTNDFITSNTQNITWIGLNDMKETNNYVWQGHERFYTNWKKGQPDNKKTPEYCTKVDKRGYWSDEPCDVSNNVICQRQMLPVTGASKTRDVDKTTRSVAQKLRSNT